MGLLEKLGLRDDPSAKLSEWLGGRLARLASETKSGEAETMDSLTYSRPCRNPQPAAT